MRVNGNNRKSRNNKKLRKTMQRSNIVGVTGNYGQIGKKKKLRKTIQRSKISLNRLTNNRSILGNSILILSNFLFLRLINRKKFD